MKITNLFDAKTAVILLLVLGALLAISPAGLRTAHNASPEELAAAITSKSNFVTAEDISAWIIDKRPDLFIIDLRSSEDYNQYHIPGAINIPLAKLFEQESLDMLSNDYLNVLYSNGDTNASQAWVMLSQTGIESYILMGGLNYWAKAILNPEPPGDLAADSEILRYQFRKSASGYFNAGGVAAAQENTAAKPAMKPKIKFKKKKAAEEGC